MHIVILESLGIRKDLMESFLQPFQEQGHTFSLYDRTSSPEILKEECRKADVLILANMPLPETALADADHLQFVDVAFTGTDHIPMEHLRSRRTPVSNCAGYATDAVAELAIAFMIDLLRSVPQVSENCRNGGTKAGWPAHLLKGKTVGFVGAGEIASATARLAKAFGARTIGYRRHPHNNDAFDEQTDLQTLLENSDIVSLHLPLNDKTRGLIGSKELALMKPGSYLVNTARGPVLDQEALIQALEAGHLGGAALDVFDQEPPIDPEQSLLQAPNLLVTPHIGFYTAESMEERARMVFQNLQAWLEGKPIHLVSD